MTKSWYKNPWVIAIGAPVLVSVILDLFKIIPVWRTLGRVLICRVPVPLAVLVLLSLLSVLFIIGLIKKYRESESGDMPSSTE